MLLVLKFDSMYVDIIDVPSFIVADATDYQDQFFVWLGDKTIDHAYWHYEDGEKYGLSYGSEAFIEWLNAFPLAETEEKAKIVSEGVRHIFF